jgi:hypothetical protein
MSIESTRPASSESSDPADQDAASLSPEDLARVERYLSSPIHRVERKPFRPYLMMLLLLSVVISLSMLSLLISWLVLE